MERIIPISDLQSGAKKYVEAVRETGHPIVITRRGRAAAVLVDYESYWGHLDTQDELSYPDWKKRLARAGEESRKGSGLLLETYLKKRKKPRAG